MVCIRRRTAARAILSHLLRAQHPDATTGHADEDHDAENPERRGCPLRFPEAYTIRHPCQSTTNPSVARSSSQRACDGWSATHLDSFRDSPSDRTTPDVSDHE